MRILVVEDDVNLSRQLSEALKEAGYVVDQAFDGEEGHYLGETEPYDAIILDIGLPEMDGYKLAGELRSRLRETSPVLIALSGYSQADDRRRSEASGFAFHLVKPLDIDALLDVLDTLVPDGRAVQA